MKRFINIVAVFGFAALFSCQDKINVDAITSSYPPSILTVYPQVSVKKGDFPLKAILVDGVSSPLKTATLILKDESGKALYTVTKDVAGTKDSVVVAGSAFNSSSLPLGSYTLDVSASDTRGNTTNLSYPFKISLTQYPANNSEMYIAGEFNNWGSTPMTLVSDFTWQVSVDLAGKTFKIKNKQDWSDKNYGDDNCSGIVSTSGGNISCGSSGPVIVTFNDKTLAYSIKSAVTYKTGLSGLYVLGNFNNFDGSNYKFQLTADNTWELAEIRLKPGDQFKFSESPTFKGKNFGDSGTPGTAAEYGPNFVRGNNDADAYYKVTFNELSLKYTITLVRYPYPDQTYLVGDASSAGWNTGNSIKFVKTADGKFEIYAYLVASGGFKFLNNVQDWPGSWGKGADGVLVQDGTGSNSNITVPSDGFYKIETNYIAKTYTTTKLTWGVVGDATPGGWNTDTPMTFVGGLGSYKWTIDITLTSGAFKFRANNNWDYNYGDNNGDNTLEAGGNNIASPGAGTYRIELTLDPINGYKYTIQ